jgi:hypothetical protein
MKLCKNQTLLELLIKGLEPGYKVQKQEQKESKNEGLRDFVWSVQSVKQF